MTRHDTVRPAPDLTVWHLVRERPVTLAVALSLILASSGLSLVQPMLAGRIIQMVEKSTPVLPWVFLLIAVAAVQISSETLGSYLQQIMGEHGSRRVRRDMGRAVLHSDFSSLSRHHLGDLVSRFTTDTDAIRNGVAHGYIQLATAAVTAVGAGTMLWVLDSVLFFIVTIVMLVAGVGAWLFLRGIEAASAGRQAALGTIGASVDRVVVAMRTIRVFDATGKERNRLNNSFDHGFDTGRRYAAWTGAVTPAIEVAATGSFLALLLVGAMRVATDQIGLATLVSALLYSTILVVPIGALIEAIVSLSTAKGALTRINEVILLPDECISHDPRREDDPPTEPLEAPGSRGLHISDLSAGYDGATTVLARVSLNVPRGDSLLIRGRSGSGKTTLVNVICRILQPLAGQVVLDGYDLLHMPPDEARRHVAIAEQDAPLLAGTVREALAYGDIRVTDTQMLTVLARLGLLTDLGGPRHALNRKLGEHGIGLSGGQRQRLALARALLAERPLLIVDEPTTGLDESNRRRVMSALQHRNSDQTLLLISHDDDARSWVDQILDFTSAAPAVNDSARNRDGG